MTRARVRSSTPRQTGLTLVELMVGMALGLLIVAALAYLYAGNRQTYRTQEAIARIQENGRLAMELMGRDLRAAGYIGCSSLADPSLKPGLLANTPPLSAWNLASVFRGFESDWGLDRNQDGVLDANDPPNGYVGNTDTFVVFTGGEGMVPLSAAMTSSTADIPIDGNTRLFKAADLMVIADCTQADMFRVSADGATALKHEIGMCRDETNGRDYNPCNAKAALSKAYGPDAQVMPVTASVYYLRNKSNGVRSLYRLPWRGGAWGASEELVEHVEAMQVVYGEDNNGDGSVDVYRKADAVNDWGRVLAVRISLLLRSPDDGVAVAAQTYVWDSDNDGRLDDTVNATDRRIRHVYTSTFTLRNR